MMMYSKKVPVSTFGYWWVLVSDVLPPICADCATCSSETLNMLNPQIEAGEHGLFGGHESEDIRTIFKKVLETL